jgi:hypothetical protein
LKMKRTLNSRHLSNSVLEITKYNRWASPIISPKLLNWAKKTSFSSVPLQTQICLR